MSIRRGWKKALFIGLAQAVAIIPGTSRSGATITAALYLGFTREAAARFSFLMSIPIIMLAGGYLGLKLVTSGEPVHTGFLLTGIATSFVSAYICIFFFLKLISPYGDDSVCDLPPAAGRGVCSRFCSASKRVALVLTRLKFGLVV